MSDVFDLRALIREVCQTSTMPDPQSIANPVPYPDLGFEAITGIAFAAYAAARPAALDRWLALRQARRTDHADNRRGA